MSQRWTPSIVPNGYDETVYLVVDCGEHGCVWREAEVGCTDLETVITDLLTAQYADPLCVVALNSNENWSRDVTADIAVEIKRRCDLANDDVPPWLEDFVHRHVSLELQQPLRLR